MPMARRVRLYALALLVTSISMEIPCTAQTRYGFGRPVTSAEIAPWDSEVAPDGKNLPTGSGRVSVGREVYGAHCAACHGARGEGGIGDKLAGGIGTLSTPNPVRTVGSYWPYATTLFDYIRRAMPMDAPRSLTDDEVYAVSGYVLYLNGLLDDTVEVDAQVLTAIRMPNRDGFVADPRPDVHATRCMSACEK